MNNSFPKNPNSKYQGILRSPWDSVTHGLGSTLKNLTLTFLPQNFFLTSPQQQNTIPNSVSKSRLNFKFEILTDPCAQSLKKSNFMTKTSASKSATNCRQHVSKHQHQQQSQPQQVLCGIFTCQGPINQVYLTDYI